MLRPYYDFTEPDKTYYAPFSKKIEEILKEAKAELSATCGNDNILPQSFTEFHPETDREFQHMFSVDWLESICNASYVKDFLDDFERDPDNRLKSYEDYIAAEGREEYVGHGWLGDKYKTIYRFKDVNEAGKRLVDHIGSRLAYCGVSEDYHLRCVDDIAEDAVDEMIEHYREFLSKEIDKKAELYKSAIHKAVNH